MNSAKLLVSAAAFAMAGAFSSALAQGSVMVGGAEMFANKTIAQNAPNADNLTTLVAAVKAAGLVDALAGNGPFTVFAPTNEAFAKLPAGTVETLLKPENKEMLTKVLLAHVIPAKATSGVAMGMIKNDGGEHHATTASGDALTLRMKGNELTVLSESGNVATVTQADVMQSNGVVHVIDTVLVPK